MVEHRALVLEGRSPLGRRSRWAFIFAAAGGGSRGNAAGIATGSGLGLGRPRARLAQALVARGALGRAARAGLSPPRGGWLHWMLV